MGLYKSQNSETEIALNYFKDRKGTILDIGANQGFFLSNSYDLIHLGWSCVAIEPSSVFEDLKELHKGNNKVEVHNIALGKNSGKLKFYESGAHVKGGDDKALVSTAVKEEMKRWKDVEFIEKEVDVMAVKDFLSAYEDKKFDYISLDVEGMEWEVLKEINLTKVGCDLLCIEFNGNKKLKLLFVDYCHKHKMKLIHQNSENLIFTR